MRSAKPTQHGRNVVARTIGMGTARLPAVVGEGAVGLSHLVGILATLHGSAKAVGGIQNLVGETLDHRVLTTLASEGDEPTQGQGVGACRTHLNRDLVGGATDAAGANLEVRANVAQGLLQGADRIGAGLLAARLESAVDDTLGGDFLPSRRILLTSMVTCSELYTGSLTTGRFGAAFLRIVYCPFLAP